MAIRRTLLGSELGTAVAVVEDRGVGSLDGHRPAVDTEHCTRCTAAAIEAYIKALSVP